MTAIAHTIKSLKESLKKCNSNVMGCPFCGGRSSIDAASGDVHKGFYASCSECEASIGLDIDPASFECEYTGKFETPEMALQAWNKRKQIP